MKLTDSMNSDLSPELLSWLWQKFLKSLTQNRFLTFQLRILRKWKLNFWRTPSIIASIFGSIVNSRVCLSLDSWNDLFHVSCGFYHRSCNFLTNYNNLIWPLQFEWADETVWWRFWQEGLHSLWASYCGGEQAFLDEERCEKEKCILFSHPQPNSLWACFFL